MVLGDSVSMQIMMLLVGFIGYKYVAMSLYESLRIISQNDRAIKGDSS
jgi:hypothetical protein